MIIKKFKLADINVSDFNPRKDLKPSDPEYIKIKKALTKFGLVEPLVLNIRNGRNRLIGGHQRIKILKEMGETEAQFSVVDLDDTQERVLAVALNKVSGEWDKDKLTELLSALDVENLLLTGFDMNELNTLLGEEPTEPELDDFIYEDVETPFWIVIRGNLLDYATVRAHVDQLQVEGMVVTDSQEQIDKKKGRG